MKIEELARKGILDLAPYIPGKSIEEVERESARRDGSSWLRMRTFSVRHLPKPWLRSAKSFPASTCIRRDPARI
jgi:hypothetical protein